MEVVVTTGAISRAKLQSNHLHQQNNIQFFTGRMPFLSPNQQCHSTEGQNLSHSMDLLTSSSPGGLPTLSLRRLIAAGYFRGGLPCLSSALWCQYPTTVESVSKKKDVKTFIRMQTPMFHWPMSTKCAVQKNKNVIHESINKIIPLTLSSITINKCKRMSIDVKHMRHWKYKDTKNNSSTQITFTINTSIKL